MKKIVYRVRDGETLKSICDRFAIPESLIIKLNGLETEVSCGDLLYLEKYEEKMLYTVKAGEGINSVARNFCVKAEDILIENSVPYLYFGQKIYIPK